MGALRDARLRSLLLFLRKAIEMPSYLRSREARWMSLTSPMCACLVRPSVGVVVVLVAVDVAALRVLPMLDAGLLARADVAIRSRACFGPIDVGLASFQT